MQMQIPMPGKLPSIMVSSSQPKKTAHAAQWRALVRSNIKVIFSQFRQHLKTNFFSYFHLTKITNVDTYYLLDWSSFIFDSFGSSQAAYGNLWYIKFPLWKEIFYFQANLLFLTRHPKNNILTAQYKQIFNEQGV